MKKAVNGKGRRVRFEVAAEPGSEVYVAGTFNRWTPGEHRLMDNPSSGEYKTTLVLPAGRHEYKFIVNGEWRADPKCSEWSANGVGSLNSVVTV